MEIDEEHTSAHIYGRWGWTALKYHSQYYNPLDPGQGVSGISRISWLAETELDFVLRAILAMALAQLLCLDVGKEYTIYEDLGTGQTRKKVTSGWFQDTKV